MCGILGYLSKQSIEINSFKKALNTLSKRGPDSQGIKKYNISHKKLLLGHKRLSILDLSSAGNQPMSDDTGNYTIIFNGEIYNYVDLKTDLIKKGHKFRSQTDTEVLLKGYIEYGQKITEKIEGMFSFAIYDKKKQLLTFARDHFGKKPFYYYLDHNTLVFASELKAITNFKKIKDKLQINKLSIIKYLFYGYIPSPNTLFKKIKKLQPATTFQFDISSWKIKNKYEFWKLENIKLRNKQTEDEILEKIDCLLENAVKKRLVSDVPLGIFLSGGVDSSIIAAKMKKFSNNVNSFTVTYKNFKDDESMYAKSVANHLKINCNIIEFNKKEVPKMFNEIIDYLDDPIADAAIIPLFFISKKAKNKITVALSGDGGDEIFGGYPKYQAQLIAEKLKYLSLLTKIIKPYFKDETINKFLSGVEIPFYSRQFVYGSGSFLPNEINKLMRLNKLDLEEIFEEASKYSKKFKQKDIINKSLYLDCKIQLPDWYLVKSDRASMAASLEIRSPSLDKELVEYIFSLNGNLKIKGTETKYLLKKLASKYIPANIIYRKKKGFAVPLDVWLNNELKESMDFEVLNKIGLFNQDYIKILINQQINKKKDNRFKLLRLIILSKYLRGYYV